MTDFIVGDFIIYIWHLTLKGDFNLNMSPFKMWGSMRYICMPNIEYLSLLIQKYMVNVKVADKQTNVLTEQRQYTPRYTKNSLAA